MHYDLLLYLMQKERDAKISEAEEDFKNLIFANNPKLYEKLFSAPVAQPGTMYNPNPDDLVVPETAGDIANLLADLKDLGLDLSETEMP